MLVSGAWTQQKSKGSEQTFQVVLVTLMFVQVLMFPVSLNLIINFMQWKKAR